MDTHVRKGIRTDLIPLRSASNVSSAVGAIEMQLKLEYVAVAWTRTSEKEEEPLFPFCIRPLMLLSHRP